MRDILDPADIWVGTPGTVFLNTNKLPVAVDDALSVLIDSGPVTVNVLANDFDPEGGALSLVSATAALGTAVAEVDDTVTYTPPPGLSGADTIVYEIEDDQGQRRSGQVKVTITGATRSIDVQPDNTLVVNAETGVIDITVSNPVDFAGSYQVDTADLTGGPVNLAPPVISGTGEAGQTLTAFPGLWIYDTGTGVPVQSWQWQRGGADIAGATATGHVVQPADVGLGLNVVETLSDSAGQRSAASAVIGTGFTPGADTALLGWWDAADTATLSQFGGAVWSWADKAGGTALTQTTEASRPTTGLRQINGLNVLDFDGSAFLEATRAFPASGNVAFHMVLAVDGTSNAFEAALAVEGVNDFQIDANNASQFDGRFNAAGIASSFNLTGGPISAPVILSVMLDRTGAGQATVYMAGTARGSSAYSLSLDPSGALHVMTNRSRNAWVNGAVGELIVTEELANRSDYHAYLATKWGLA